MTQAMYTPVDLYVPVESPARLRMRLRQTLLSGSDYFRTHFRHVSSLGHAFQLFYSWIHDVESFVARLAQEGVLSVDQATVLLGVINDFYSDAQADLWMKRFDSPNVYSVDYTSFLALSDSFIYQKRNLFDSFLVS